MSELGTGEHFVMQLADYNQLVLSAIFAALGKHTNVEITEDQVRHILLNIVRSIRTKFRSEFGEVVICCDGKNSWRRSVFPYYKAGRKKSRDESELDWGKLFGFMDTVRNELADVFPYRVVHLDHVEADDIIGVLCHEHGVMLNNGSEPILIHSSDKDFIQLQVYANVKQFDPISKKWVTHPDPEEYKFEHILRGDVGDGIPNVLSADDALVTGERQRSLTAKRVARYRETLSSMDELTRIRYARNKMLIDLGEIPAAYREQILEMYSREPNNRSGLFDFFVEKGLKQLMEKIGDF